MFISIYIIISPSPRKDVYSIWGLFELMGLKHFPVVAKIHWNRFCLKMSWWESRHGRSVYPHPWDLRRDLGICTHTRESLNCSYSGKNLGFPYWMCDCTTFSMVQEWQRRDKKRQKTKNSKQINTGWFSACRRFMSQQKWSRLCMYRIRKKDKIKTRVCEWRGSVIKPLTTEWWWNSISCMLTQNTS